MEYFNLESNSRFFPDFSQHGYIVERKLGNNFNQGRVTYQAIELSTKQVVAIKQFQFAVDGNSWSDYEALECEINFLQQLNHPSIPKYINSFETDSGFCLVQEYKNAPNLAQTRYFKLDEIRKIAISILEILIYLQHQTPPIIHRDIKPENILVNEKLNVYLVDFGLAKTDGQNSTSNSIIKGTLGFMPPEQMFCRPLSAASDLYGLGMTLICLLTGTPSSQVGKLIDDNHRVNVRSLLPNINPGFISWLEKMVAPVPQDRYPNADKAFVALLNPKINDLSKTDNDNKPAVLKPIGLFMLPISLSLISNISNSFIPHCQTEPLKRENIRNEDNTSIFRRLHRNRLNRHHLRRYYLDRYYLNKYHLNRHHLHEDSDYWQRQSVRNADLRKSDLKKAKFQNMNSRSADSRNIEFEGTNFEENGFTEIIILNDLMDRE